MRDQFEREVYCDTLYREDLLKSKSGNPIELNVHLPDDCSFETIGLLV